MKSYTLRPDIFTLNFNFTLSGTARRMLFELEGGICTLCGVNAQEMWEKIRQLSPPERMQALMNSVFKVSSKALKSPSEGDFWQADHIIPVSEGGGECTLSNLRTLCTPCHERETAKLKQRLKLKGAPPAKDIRGFFGGLGKKT